MSAVLMLLALGVAAVVFILACCIVAATGTMPPVPATRDAGESEQ